MGKIIAKFILSLFGWKIKGNIPKEADRCVMIAAPHTTNWDGIIMRIALFVLDVPVKIAIKDFWTKFPMGLIVKPFGGLGINRRPKVPGEARKSQVEQLANFFNTYSKIALIVAPEGSRSLRTEWKKGFYYTAKMANVPICYGFLDYAKKEAGVGGVIYPTDDLEADMKQIMAFYRNIQGKYPEKFSIDERYGALAKGNS